MIRTLQDFEKFGHVMALLPMYDETGECVKILYDDRPAETRKISIRTELRRCARAFGYAIPYLRENTRHVFGRSQLELPLALAPYFVLVPYRYRVPRAKKDPTLAYLNFPHIADVKPAQPLLGPGAQDARVTVAFSDGQTIPVRNNYASACRHFREGCTARDHLLAILGACGPVTPLAFAPHR